MLWGNPCFCAAAVHANLTRRIDRDGLAHQCFGFFALAAMLFTVSIGLRSVDLAWCDGWVWGTHWAWHLLNAGVLTLAMLGLSAAREQRMQGR